MIEARHLRVLRAVARTGSFSAAARELGCTQPAISQQMKALEKSVDTPLVVRSGRGMQLSEAGRVLLKHATGILAGLSAAEEEVAAIAGLRAGRVRLVSFPTASSTLVPPAVARLRGTHPGVRVSLVEAEPPESLAMLRGGECEVALAFRYPQATGSVAAPAHGTPREARAEANLEAQQLSAGADWSDLVATPLLDDPLVGLLPAGHRLAGRGGPVELAELAEEQWIAGCPQCRGHLVELCAGAGFEPRIDFATDDYPAVVGLVAAGLGVAVLPGLALESVRPDGVATVAVHAASGAPAVRQVVALTLPDLAEVPAVALMLERLAGAATGR
ncbi:LysR family transcriptional regulator [Kitasatospora purpeofusca]|uniref:LysR family transcriptional regulator n=1 Tax=Kitasatospora purpeofusca TaxID=67352 RepID=UPI002252A39B|nr:LysR family transcriptional regulator [Kitasatospora purpeofusca]MCX4753266.1 LysR family transcriptional regulator [Kitasatospora purpeofusca]WSR32782.1 LysR family transcriptional regulator [Kitasatospora purpeofusca]WSR40873.1 LysR family transcriptional regulator [Kitasatospora purpeofusca]